VSREHERIAYIGDVHLEPGDPDLAAFNRMLERLAAECTALVLMGDLFTLWIGQPGLQGPHHTAVLETLRAIRKRGVETHYIEGNRDFGIGGLFRGDAFDTSDEHGLGLRVAGRSLWAIHGDLANTADWQYRSWRGISRFAGFWWCFNMLPAGRRLAVAERLERTMRGTNLAHKREFPTELISSYAESFVARGHRDVVLGHFHVEKHWVLDDGAAVWVLPEWKGSRRHLLADPDGVRFVDSPS
jgi:UDP-2,3-diacylglucosamine hydrolase